MTYITDPLPGALLPETPPGQARQASPPRSAASLAARLQEWRLSLDDAVSRALRPAALPALRVMLGLLLLWFGMLKVIGRSPAWRPSLSKRFRTGTALRLCSCWAARK